VCENGPTLFLTREVHLSSLEGLVSAFWLIRLANLEMVPGIETGYLDPNWKYLKGLGGLIPRCSVPLPAIRRSKTFLTSPFLLAIFIPVFARVLPTFWTLGTVLRSSFSRVPDLFARSNSLTS